MDINFNKNEDHNKLLLSELRNRFAKIKLGGGKGRIEKHHAKAGIKCEHIHEVESTRV